MIMMIMIMIMIATAAGIDGGANEFGALRILTAGDRSLGEDECKLQND